MLIELRMASFSCVAFWKMEAIEAMSPLLFRGGPRGGNSGCCSVGVATFELVVELLPERCPDDELEPELRDLLSCGIALVLLTILLEGRALWVGSVAVALVKVNVKYCVSSMLHMEMMQDAWIAFLYGLFFSGWCKEPLGLWMRGDITTSTDTSWTVVRTRLVLLNWA